jgi:hypothetical protein
MKPSATAKKPVKNLDTGEVFESACLASEHIKRHKSIVWTAIKKGCKAGGYRWAYCDENGNVINKKEKKL